MVNLEALQPLKQTMPIYNMLASISDEQHLLSFSLMLLVVQEIMSLLRTERSSD